MNLLGKTLCGAAACVAPLYLSATSFEDASHYLDTDGSFVAYIDFVGDGADAGQQLNAILAEARTSIPQTAAFPINFEQLIDQLGFGSLQALGASSKVIGNGLQANRSVMLTNGSLSGLFSLYGSPSEPMKGFDLAKRAPADSNTVISGPIDLIPLRELVEQLMAQYMGAVGTSLVDQQLTTPLMGTDITANELIEALSGQLEFCMYQDYNDTFSPAYKFWASFENAGFLVERLKSAEDSLPILFSESDGASLADLSFLLGQEDMGLFLRHDPSGALQLYTHTDWGAQADGPKLADSTAFGKFSTLLPEKAHWYRYTKGAGQDLEAMFTSLEGIPEAAAYLGAGRKIFDLLLGDFMQPAASATILTDAAVYSELYACYSYKRMVTVIPAVIGGGIAASVAIPYYMFGQSMGLDFDMAMSDEELVKLNLNTILNTGQLYLLSQEG